MKPRLKVEALGESNVIDMWTPERIAAELERAGYSDWYDQQASDCWNPVLGDGAGFIPCGRNSDARNETDSGGQDEASLRRGLEPDENEVGQTEREADAK